jgi:hypothetical protein
MVVVLPAAPQHNTSRKQQSQAYQPIAAAHTAAYLQGNKTGTHLCKLSK